MLADHIWTNGMAVGRAIAEMPLRFDGFAGNPRKSDLVIFGQVEGKGVVVAAEAKADEAFGPLIGEYREQNLGTGSRIPDRIDQLARAIFGRSRVDADIASLRYQLVHALAGVLAEAGRRGLSRSVLLIHEFRSRHLNNVKVKQNANDLDHFAQVVTEGRAEIVPSGRLIGPFRVPGGGMIPTNSYFLIGKVVTYLVSPGVVRSEPELPY